MQVFIYKEGLTRFATENYTNTNNLKDGDLFMHLTNYAINKESAKFQENESDFKKSLQDTFDHIAAVEGADKVEKLWKQIIDICIKTMLIAYPHLEHNYKSCTSKSSAKSNRQCF